MKRHLLTLTAAIGLMAILTAGKASAQTLNMDMSKGIRNLMYEAQGDTYARAVAAAYYNHMLQLRRIGYTGPSLPTGVTAQTLQAANQRLSRLTTLESKNVRRAAGARGAGEALVSPTVVVLLLGLSQQ